MILCCVWVGDHFPELRVPSEVVTYFAKSCLIDTVERIWGIYYSSWPCSASFVFVIDLQIFGAFGAVPRDPGRTSTQFTALQGSVSCVHGGTDHAQDDIQA